MSLKIKSVVALALSAAMLFSTAACGTSEASNSGDSSDSSNATTGYDVSTIKKDDELAKLVPSGDLVKDGELSAGMELSYAPAEFYAEDGKTPVGYDIDMTKAIAKTLGLKPNIVSSMFDTIIPSIGSKYDLGITAMTITEERLQSVDFRRSLTLPACAARRSRCRQAPCRKRKPTPSPKDARPITRPK